jgi:hypothetical protein
VAGLTGPLDAWRGDLAAWAIPEHISAAVTESPGCSRGSWPDAALRVPAADVVTCHHVLCNVPGLASFVTALTAHAGRRSTSDRRDATS